MPLALVITPPSVTVPSDVIFLLINHCAPVTTFFSLNSSIVLLEALSWSKVERISLASPTVSEPFVTSCFRVETLNRPAPVLIKISSRSVPSTKPGAVLIPSKLLIALPTIGILDTSISGPFKNEQ